MKMPSNPEFEKYNFNKTGNLLKVVWKIHNRISKESVSLS
jgi:hypothetical protein